jgi:hypothetical protein
MGIVLAARKSGDNNSARRTLHPARQSDPLTKAREAAHRGLGELPCSYRSELDMKMLVWTRGRAFPLSRLESRLRCLRCGSHYVVVLYEPPRRGATSIAGLRSPPARSSKA